jgi:hypothetical protein
MWKRDPFDDLDARRRSVGIESDAHAKLSNFLFTLALARRLIATKCRRGRQAVTVPRGLASRARSLLGPAILETPVSDRDTLEDVSQLARSRRKRARK